jgi:putative ABC transport system permease protein
MSLGEEKRRYRPHLWLIQVVSFFVPRRFRPGWKQEWEAELRHREDLLQRWQKLDLRSTLELLKRSSGSFWDALWLQPKRLEDDVYQDLRFGIRMMLKHRAFTLVAVTALALGVGANTAIFSIVNSVLLRPLPYNDSQRLMVANLSVPDFEDLKGSSSVFDRMAIWASNQYRVSFDDGSKQLLGALVSQDFMPMLGAPEIGRTFKPEEGRDQLALISHDLWKSRFGGAPEVLGKAITLNGEPHTIIGVMPPEFQFPSQDFKIWVPFASAMAKAPEQSANRQLRIFRALAHLKPGIERSQVEAEMNAFSKRLQQEYPRTNEGVRTQFTPIYERIVGDVRPALLVLLGTVGFILLIACANVANLSLARMTTRERELAIRIALGAKRFRIARQLLTESLLLALLGGALGLAFAKLGIELLPTLNPVGIPRISEINIDFSVLLFTLLLSVAAAIFFGVFPAWQSTRSDINGALKEGSRGALGSPKGKRLRAALVVVEIALSLVVLIGAGLLIKSFAQLLKVDSGFVSENLLTANVGFIDYKDPVRRAAVAREVIDRIKALPGVQFVGGGTGLPPITPQRGTRFAVQGLSNDDAEQRSAYFLAVSPDYFQALGTPVSGGRPFSERDQADTAKVVIINRMLARRLFPNESAVGKHIQLVNPEQGDDWREIVGVVGDVRYSGLDDPSDASIYTPFSQTPGLWNYLMIRTTVPPQTIVQAVRQSVVSISPDLEPANFQTMGQLVSQSVAQPRFYALLLAAFALLALVLAIVGIYGVVSYSVTQRTHEIGVRMALGAARADVIRLVLGQGVMLALAGTLLGVLSAYAVTRLMTNLLFGVSTADPMTFAVTAAAMMVLAPAACFLPARRATRVDPIVALRYE